MQRRIFIAINLPENIKKELSSFQKKWPELPCRWIKKDNLHITLVFLGYLRDEELPEILKMVREVSLKNEPFFLNLKRVDYGPIDKKSPRMVWVEGEKSQELGKLQEDLKNSLARLSSELKREEGRGYIPHITLGRLRQWEFRQIEPEERPEIQEDINLSFKVNSIEVMESQLKREGAEYTVLESAPLANLPEYDH